MDCRCIIQYIQKYKIMKEEKKLKPVILFNGKYNYNGKNDFQQRILLKALQVTTDPNELRKLAGLKTVAEVYRTLDKLSIRKEYHEALARAGISLDLVVDGIKDICVNGSSDKVKLSGWLALLKTIGLDEYKENAEGVGATWEEMVRDVAQEEMASDKKEDNIIKDYEVNVPPTPKDEIEIEKEEKSGGVSLYED